MANKLTVLASVVAASTAMMLLQLKQQTLLWTKSQNKALLLVALVPVYLVSQTLTQKVNGKVST